MLCHQRLAPPIWSPVLPPPMDSIPVVAITANVGTSPPGQEDSFQEVDIASITMPVTSQRHCQGCEMFWQKPSAATFKIARTRPAGPCAGGYNQDVTADVCEYVPDAGEAGASNGTDPPGGSGPGSGNLISAAKSPSCLWEAGPPLPEPPRRCGIGGKDSGPGLRQPDGQGTFRHPPAVHRHAGHARNKTSNLGMYKCDLVIVLGQILRQDVGDANISPTRQKILQIDVNAARRSIKTWWWTLPVTGDVREVLKRLLPMIPVQEHPQWIAGSEMKSSIHGVP